ncbi:hypothetical protein P43SY_004632 [Pythium insidiosum]|uniref:WRKY19-like zinc finger domain-containing protein n=1 Tax=Pythium insidiosum TaxID=114742 RepID=A0AAD5Q2B8_PYTIN|nr:hypothetical protein P43SY_004632 [Pythium insidiosum]
MPTKSHISFLLNPEDIGAMAPLPLTPPRSPLLSDAALCPTTLAATSLAMLSAVCINPIEKRRVCPAPVDRPNKRKRFLDETSSSGTSDDDEEEDNSAPHEHHHHHHDEASSSTPKSAGSRCGNCQSDSATPTRKKPRTPPCQVEGCPNMAVSRGCCVRHGGGSRCVVAGCSNRAKLYKRCFQHGGYKTCQAPDCSRKAKRYGYCWSHGGGRICEVEGCAKVSTQGGLCWAHGGGNRCRLEGCSRRSYQKYDYYCVDHAEHRHQDKSSEACASPAAA